MTRGLFPLPDFLFISMKHAKVVTPYRNQKGFHRRKGCFSSTSSRPLGQSPNLPKTRLNLSHTPPPAPPPSPLHSHPHPLTPTTPLYFFGASIGAIRFLTLAARGAGWQVQGRRPGSCAGNEAGGEGQGGRGSSAGTLLPQQADASFGFGGAGGEGQVLAPGSRLPPGEDGACALAGAAGAGACCVV